MEGGRREVEEGFTADEVSVMACPTRSPAQQATGARTAATSHLAPLFLIYGSFTTWPGSKPARWLATPELPVGSPPPPPRTALLT